jgi:hypothetical protein
MVPDKHLIIREFGISQTSHIMLKCLSNVVRIAEVKVLAEIDLTESLNIPVTYRVPNLATTPNIDQLG